MDEMLRKNRRGIGEYGWRQRPGFERQHWCAEIKIWAERQAGELLQEMQRHRPQDGRPSRKASDDSTHLPTLDELGISRDQSSRFQTIARLPEPEFEARLAAGRGQGSGHASTPAATSAATGLPAHLPSSG